MRRTRDVSEIDNARIERRGPFDVLKRDPVEPEPVGTIVLIPFRVTGYRPDCDGSLMANLEKIDPATGEATGLEVKGGDLDGFVVTLEELVKLTHPAAQ